MKIHAPNKDTLSVKHNNSKAFNAKCNNHVIFLNYTALITEYGLFFVYQYQNELSIKIVCPLNTFESESFFGKLITVMR